MIPVMGSFFCSVSGHMSVFLMVNCTRLLPLTVYNPPGTYGAGDKFEVIITVVPGFRSIVDSVTTFRSSCGVVPLCVGSGVFLIISCDRKYVRIASFGSGASL